ncbi:MAG TPA: DUF4328 domain-containing protein [Micropepsaceae bacterium]|nr:DUF4328 domain-containing protein [Micropepsaceae bacterium]
MGIIENIYRRIPDALLTAAARTGIAAILALIAWQFGALASSWGSPGADTPFLPLSDSFRRSARAGGDETMLLVSNAVRAIWLLSWTAIAVWLYRMAENARELSNAKIETTPRMLLVSFLAPVLNFVWPYVALRDVLRASSRQGEDLPRILIPLCVSFSAFIAVIDSALILMLLNGIRPTPASDALFQYASSALLFPVGLLFFGLTLDLPARQQRKRNGLTSIKAPVDRP